MRVATARVATHRRLGVAGAALAVVMVIVGTAMTVDAMRRGVDPVGVGPRVWWLGNTLPPILLFAGFVGAALALRRRAAAHKRLMLLATMNLAGPALVQDAGISPIGVGQGQVGRTVRGGVDAGPAVRRDHRTLRPGRAC